MDGHSIKLAPTNSYVCIHILTRLFSSFQAELLNFTSPAIRDTIRGLAFIGPGKKPRASLYALCPEEVFGIFRGPLIAAAVILVSGRPSCYNRLTLFQLLNALDEYEFGTKATVELREEAYGEHYRDALEGIETALRRPRTGPKIIEIWDSWVPEILFESSYFAHFTADFKLRRTVSPGKRSHVPELKLADDEWNSD
jgi:hypothetical protein